MIEKELFLNRTTNGFSEIAQLLDGNATIEVEGTLDGAILKCQARNDKRTEWKYTGDIDNLFSGQEIKSFLYLPNTQIRYELTNAGASTNITLIFNN